MTKTITEAISERRATLASATVYHLGVLINTYAALSPAQLETHELTRVFHENGAALQTLLTVIDGFEFGAKSENGIDARWGLAFETAGGVRAGAIYINEFGTVVSDGESTFELVEAGEAMATLRAAYGTDGVIE